MRRAVLLALLVVAVAVPARADAVKLIGFDTAGGDTFGASVAADGDRIVVGAPGNDNTNGFNAGAAYVFLRSGSSWTQEAKLAAEGGVHADAFGSAVAISGDTVVVGAPLVDLGGRDAGAAYVFVRTPSGWSQQARLVPPDARAGDHFGSAVSVSGDRLAVGSPSDDTLAGDEAGSVYLYVRSGSTWSLEAKLEAADARFSDFFGTSVSLDGSTLVVGAPGKLSGTSSNAGAAYVFTLSEGAWGQRAKLALSDAAAQDQFGAAVAVDGDLLLVGAPGRDTAVGSNAGAGYAFRGAGSSWTMEAELLDAAGAPGDQLGTSVAVLADTAALGAPFQDVPADAAGGVATYVTTAEGWRQTATLTAPDGATLDQLGNSVALTTGAVVAGAWKQNLPGDAFDAGAVYVFGTRPPDTTPPETIIDAPPPAISSPSVTITFHGTDDQSPPGALRFSCSLDEAPFSRCRSPAVLSGLAAGTHTFAVQAADEAGNTDPTPATVSWQVDAAGPRASITTPNGAILLRTPLVTTPVEGTAADDLAGVAAVVVRFEGLTPATGAVEVAASLDCTGGGLSCTWSANPPALIGPFWVMARATDAAGNTGPPAGPIRVIVLGAG